MFQTKLMILAMLLTPWVPLVAATLLLFAYRKLAPVTLQAQDRSGVRPRWSTDASQEASRAGLHGGWR